MKTLMTLCHVSAWIIIIFLTFRVSEHVFHGSPAPSINWLCEKYGTTPEEWKAACKTWIEVGGHYEYRIGTRTDVVEWEISYRENSESPVSNPS